MNPFWMVLADLRKTVFSSLGVLILLALAFSATVAVNLLERSLQQAGTNSASEFDLVIGAPGSRLDLVLASVFLRTDEVLPLLDASLVPTLAADPRVAAISPLIFADNHRGYPIIGVGPDLSTLRPSFRLASGRWPQAPFEVLAGNSTGTLLGESFVGSHGVHEQEEAEHHEEAEFVVVGTLKFTGTPWDRAYLTPYESIWHLHETSEGEPHEVSALLVKPRDFASAYSLRAQYREGTTTAAFPGEVLAGLFGLFDEIKKTLSLLAVLFQALVFAAVLLSLLAALPSKARWIGLLRALGAGKGYIFLTLWLQTALVFTAAVLFGAALGWVGVQALTSSLTSQIGMTMTVQWSLSETLLLGLFWVVGLAGALVPAVAGYRKSVRQSVLGSA